MPSITPTTLLVAGSMTCTLSPALLVWMIRTFLPPWSWAARPIVHRKIAADIPPHPGITRLLLLFLGLFTRRLPPPPDSPPPPVRLFPPGGGLAALFQETPP